MKMMREIFEVIFFARGGQGAKTAAEILSQAAVREGKYVQAFPDFGPERSGAPMKTYVRISDNPIRIHSPIVDPDIVVVLDDTLLGVIDVSKNLDQNEYLIVNTTKDQKEVQRLSNTNAKVYTIDATGIAMEIIGEPRPNTAIVGKLVKASEIVKLDNVSEVFREKYLGKIGFEKTQKNILAIERAYDLM